MDLTSLRCFVEVVRAGSLNRAAASLHMAQPALSRRMRSLEAELGVLLLRRSPEGVEPTRPGVLLLRHADHILAAVAAARQEVTALREQPAGEVRLGITPGAGQMLVPRLYEALQEEHPGIVLLVTESTTAEIDASLRRGAYDAAIYPDPGASPLLRCLPLIEERIYLVSDREAPTFMQQRQAVPFEALNGIPLILPSKTSFMTRQLRNYAAARQVRLNVVTEVTSVHIAKALVRGSGGLTILGFSSVREELRSGALNACVLAPPDLKRRFVFAIRRHDERSLTLNVLQSVVVREVKRLVLDGLWEGELLYEECL